MIKSLYIRNYAIIEELTLEFSDGLTIITGETGAGKSILIGALGLILGKRADTKSLYQENEKCIVEGLFDVQAYGLEAFFAEQELDYAPEIIVRREIAPGGKSRAFVNDTPVRLKVLQALSNELIDLHQQFDTLDIHDVSFQLRMIDALAGNKMLLLEYQKAYRDYRRDQRKLQELREQNARAAREYDFLQFQLQELEAADLQPGEQERLESEERMLNSAGDIKRAMSAARHQLTESEQAVVDQLQEIGVSLQQLRSINPELDALSLRFQSALIELQDIASECEKMADRVEFDPGRTAEVQQRLDLLNRLQSKHLVNSVNALLEVRDHMQNQLIAFADQGEEIAKLEQALQQQARGLEERALELRERRAGVLTDFEQQVKARLGLLAMEHAQLQAVMEASGELGPSGKDVVTFLFAANKGSRPQPIKDVASGGELSRLALVIKSLVASAIPLPTLIFDEIDSGISGDVAIKMGRILRSLSDEHQVVSITHSPQIASKAEAHYFVFKETKDDRTLTQVRLLGEEDRIRVIATMLSQHPPTDSAIENAKELLSLAR